MFNSVWQKFNTSFLQFRKGERRAIVVLICLLVALSIYLWTRNQQQQAPLDAAKIARIDSLMTLVDTSTYRPKKYNNYSKKQKHARSKDDAYPQKSYVLKDFDPNVANKEELLSLGIPKRTVNTILNFRKKNGKFYKPEDLKKIYGLHEELYDKLAPYIEITSKKKKRKIYAALDNEVKKPEAAKLEKKIPYEPISKTEEKENIIRLVDINTTDSSSLKAIRGIGTYLSAAIIRQRERLGGYYDVSQIREIRGLRDSTYQLIKDQLIATGGINKIDINIADKELLAKHPYISWSQAKLIIKYREQHGPYRDIKDLLKIKVINESFFNKIAPYIEI